MVGGKIKAVKKGCRGVQILLSSHCTVAFHKSASSLSTALRLVSAIRTFASQD